MSTGPIFDFSSYFKFSLLKYVNEPMIHFVCNDVRLAIDLFRVEVTWSVMGKQDKKKWRLRAVLADVEKEKI